MKVKIIIALVALAINGTTIMAQEKIKQTAGRDQLGEFAPKFAELMTMYFSEKCGTVRTSLDCATEVW